MNAYLNRLDAAFAAVLIASFTSGCTILPFDKGSLVMVIPISAVHDTVEAAATTAPAAAEAPYNNLRKDFNALISHQQAMIAKAGTTVLMYSEVDFSKNILAADPNIQRDLAEFAAAAPTMPSAPVLSGSMNATDVLTERIYPAVSAIKDSRLDQAATFNQELEKLKLAPWETVNKPSVGTR